jgi:phage-related protein
MIRRTDKPLRWLVGALSTPSVGGLARIEAGELLRRLQGGEMLAMPRSRPMPGIGRRVHELRVADRETTIDWRIVYRIDADAILVVHWFEKRTRTTPGHVVDLCSRRLERYDRG